MIQWKRRKEDKVNSKRDLSSYVDPQHASASTENPVTSLSRQADATDSSATFSTGVGDDIPSVAGAMGGLENDSLEHSDED